MPHPRRSAVALSITTLTVLAAALVAPSPATAARPAAQRAPMVPVVATTSQAATLVEDDAADRVGASVAAADALALAPTATFSVTYAGFSPEARRAFQRAVNSWSRRVVSSVPITISARFEPLAPGVLGSAGASLVHRDFAGAPQASTYYVDALANARAGRQLAPSADINARFSSSFTNWHFGTGPAPLGTYDFQTVVMHEIGHGLGFVGAGRVSGGTGTVRSSGIPLAYDRFTENRAGRSLLSFADPSSALADQLTRSGVSFDTPAVRQANGGRPARLYAPASFQNGSSYSHLDEATYPPGSRNALMTPAIGDGETIRTPGPVTQALFRSLGW